MNKEVSEYNQHGCDVIPQLIISKCITHPHIIECDKVVRMRDKVEVIYSYKGIYLKTLISNDELTMKEKIKIIYEIGTAISMLHSKGYKHGYIKVDNILGEYNGGNGIYYVPKIMTRASRDDNFSSDVEDFKVFILDMLCPEIKESYIIDKSDLSVILPYVPNKLKNFISRICHHSKIFEIISSPEFDDIKDKSKSIIVYNFKTVVRNSNYNDKYRNGLKEIYCIFKDYLNSRYIDELFVAIDIYNRSYVLVDKHNMNLQCYYCACILLSTKVFSDDKLSIDDIRDAIHDVIKSHPKREDVLSAELDIIACLNGLIYTPYIYDECKNVNEIYGLLTFYILDKELYKDYHLFHDKLVNKHKNDGGVIRADTYLTCKEFFELDEKITDDELDKLESFL